MRSRQLIVALFLLATVTSCSDNSTPMEPRVTHVRAESASPGATKEGEVTQGQFTKQKKEELNLFLLNILSLNSVKKGVWVDEDTVDFTGKLGSQSCSVHGLAMSKAHVSVRVGIPIGDYMRVRALNFPHDGTVRSGCVVAPNPPKLIAWTCDECVKARKAWKR